MKDKNYYKLWDVGKMYHQKALALVPKRPVFKPYVPLTGDPFHDSDDFPEMRPETAIKGRTIGWLRERDPLVSGTLDELSIQSALVFFREHIAGTLTLNVVPFAIRYEMASLLYFNFEKICSALEDDGIIPDSYTVCLHQLILEIEKPLKPKRGQAANEKRATKSLVEERKIARDVYDKYVPDKNGIISIPIAKWDEITNKYAGEDGWEDKTIKKYQQNAEIPISVAYRNKYRRRVKIKIIK